MACFTKVIEIPALWFCSSSTYFVKLLHKYSYLPLEWGKAHTTAGSESMESISISDYYQVDSSLEEHLSFKEQALILLETIMS